jgi:hypothetical protein
LLCFVHLVIPLVVVLGVEYIEELSLKNQISEFCRLAASFNKNIKSLPMVARMLLASHLLCRR